MNGQLTSTLRWNIMQLRGLWLVILAIIITGQHELATWIQVLLFVVFRLKFEVSWFLSICFFTKHIYNTLKNSHHRSALPLPVVKRPVE